MNKRKTNGSHSHSNINTKSNPTSDKKPKKLKKSLFLNGEDFHDQAAANVSTTIDCVSTTDKNAEDVLDKNLNKTPCGDISISRLLGTTPRIECDLPKESTPIETPKLNVQRRRSKSKHLNFAKENLVDKCERKSATDSGNGLIENVHLGKSLNDGINDSDLINSETLVSIENKSADDGLKSEFNKSNSFKSNNSTRTSITRSQGGKRPTSFTRTNKTQTAKKKNVLNLSKSKQKDKNKQKTPQKSLKNVVASHSTTPLLPGGCDGFEDNIRDDSLLKCLNSPIHHVGHTNTNHDTSAGVAGVLNESSCSLLGQALKDDSMFANLELTQMVSCFSL